MNFLSNSSIEAIGDKVSEGKRLSAAEGLRLYESNEIGLLGVLASMAKQRKSGKKVYYNKNAHLEPTNICVYSCKFCSYSCKSGDKNSREKNIDQIVNEAKRLKSSDITELHIVGGVHPERDVHYYSAMLKAIREILPEVHIKAFSAVELEFMFEKAGVSIEEGFEILKQSGLQSIPGGGAEIFDYRIRRKICSEKTTSKQWLEIHRSAHKAGLFSNATMLYGHIEKYKHRIEHLMKLRELQDETKGFNAFIPLKFRAENSPMAHLGEQTAIEDMKNYAVSRIFLDNITHMKAYWPMIGKDMAQLALAFGADDLDGATEDPTKIYTVESLMNTEQIKKMIRDVGYTPVERDSLYNKIVRYESF